MYIVRWLMGHPIIATWALGAIAILLTLGQGQNTKPVEHSPVVSKHSDTDNLNIGKNIDSGLEKVTDKVLDSSDTSDASLDLSKTSIPQVLSSVISDSEKKTSNITLDPSDKNDGISDASKNTRSDAAVNNLSRPPEKEVVSESSVVSDLAVATTEELLQMAREAYWNNGLDEAAQLYMQLIEAQPTIIEYKGELGNVYWRQGYPKKAAELYLEIAAPMIESGDSERVANMIGFIGLFFPEQAADLGNKMPSK